MINSTKSVIINQTVSVKVGDQQKNVMTFGATIGSDGASLTITQRILDKALYDANQAEMEAKYDEFIVEARNKAQEAWAE